MVFLDPSEYTDFQREVVEKVNAALPAMLPSYMTPTRHARVWEDIEVEVPVRWACGETPMLVAQEKGSDGAWREICPHKPWWSQSLKSQPPLGQRYHVHARCEVRARINGIAAWDQVGALTVMEEEYFQMLSDTMSRDYVRVQNHEWHTAPDGVVAYTEMDNIAGAIVDEDGDLEYDNTHTYEAKDTGGWRLVD
jgi:hypothetical protein